MKKDLPFFGQRTIATLSEDDINAVDMSRFRLSTSGIIQPQNDVFETAWQASLRQLEQAMGEFVTKLPAQEETPTPKRVGMQEKSIW